MGYTILTGPGAGQFDSAHDSDDHALRMARELVRQGRERVRIVDENGASHTLTAFETLVANGEAGLS